jgi:hypothetical protein
MAKSSTLPLDIQDGIYGKKRKLEKPDCHASLAMTASKNKRRILNAPLKLKKQPKILNKEVRIGLSG